MRFRRVFTSLFLKTSRSATFIFEFLAFQQLTKFIRNAWNTLVFWCAARFFAAWPTDKNCAYNSNENNNIALSSWSCSRATPAADGTWLARRHTIASPNRWLSRTFDHVIVHWSYRIVGSCTWRQGFHQAFQIRDCEKRPIWTQPPCCLRPWWSSQLSGIRSLETISLFDRSTRKRTVSLVEEVLGGLSKISEGWWSHFWKDINWSDEPE